MSRDAFFIVAVRKETTLRGDGFTNSNEYQKAEISIDGKRYEWTGKGEGNQPMEPVQDREIRLSRGFHKVRIKIFRRRDGSSEWQEAHYLQARKEEVNGYCWIAAVAEEGDTYTWDSCTMVLSHHDHKPYQRMPTRNIEIEPGETAYFYPYALGPIHQRIKIGDAIFEASSGHFSPFTLVQGEAKITNDTHRTITVQPEFSRRVKDAWRSDGVLVGPRISRVFNLTQYTEIAYFNTGNSPTASAVLTVRKWKRDQRPLVTVAALDRSGSMKGTKGTSLKIASKAYFDAAQKADGIAAVSFATEASRLYPSQGSEVATVDKRAGRVQSAMRDAIQALTFDGWTNITGAIRLARGFLDNKKYFIRPRGLALISDGEHNEGDPPKQKDLPTEYPISTCCISPAEEEGQKLLKWIADKTGGTYLYGNDVRPSAMKRLFNSFRQVHSAVHLVENSHFTCEGADYKLIKVALNGDHEIAQIGIAWSNEAVQRTDNNPDRNQFRFSLVSPKGGKPIEGPIHDGEQYLWFHGHRLDPGEWKIQIECGEGKGLEFCCGVFETEMLAGNLPVVRLRALPIIRKGEDLPLEADAHDQERPMRELHVVARVTRPTRTLEQALKHYRPQLGRYAPTVGAVEAGFPEDFARLHTFHDATGADLLGETTEDIAMDFDQKTGTYRGKLPGSRTRTPGPYTVHLEARGTSESTGSMVQRCWTASTVVSRS